MHAHMVSITFAACGLSCSESGAGTLSVCGVQAFDLNTLYSKQELNINTLFSDSLMQFFWIKTVPQLRRSSWSVLLFLF